MKIPPSLSKSSALPRAFTLLELLMVFAIILVVVGLAAPLAGGIGKSRALTGAGNHLADLLASARQNSMTKNCLTVLLIPAGDGQWNSAILYELRPRADGSAPTSDDWKPVSKWENLPNGVTIDDTTFVTEAQSTQLPASLPAIQRGGEAITQYRFVTFMPRGILYPKTVPQGGNPYLRLARGTRSGGNVILEGAKSGTPANLYKIIVLSSTGITKIERN
jgi:prepilin-type N-terminal cleavage/methylation domain-containing protein